MMMRGWHTIRIIFQSPGRQKPPLSVGLPELPARYWWPDWGAVCPDIFLSQQTRPQKVRRDWRGSGAVYQGKAETESRRLTVCIPGPGYCWETHRERAQYRQAGSDWLQLQQSFPGGIWWNQQEEGKQPRIARSVRRYWNCGQRRVSVSLLQMFLLLLSFFPTDLSTWWYSTVVYSITAFCIPCH